MASDKAFAETAVLRVDIGVPLAEVGARIDMLSARVDVELAVLSWAVVAYTPDAHG